MALGDFLDFAEARVNARRRLPRGIFEYIDRGAEAETAIRRNRADLDRIRITPRVLAGGSARQLETCLFQTTLALPLAIAPTAFAGIVRYRGEAMLAKAARNAGIPYCIATESVTSVEDVQRDAGGAVWFQLYLWEGEENWRRLLARAQASGVTTLLLTVDTPVYPKRVYNIRSGFGLPITYGLRNIADVVSRPAWACDVLGRGLLGGGLPKLAHHPQSDKASLLGRGLAPMRFQPGLSWAHVERLRDAWPGTLLLKGVLHPEDARRAKALGAEGLVVSSHGMRNLDSAVSVIEALPAVRDAVGSSMAVLADSGVQRGSDIFKLLQGGADAVLAGRALLYGLACGGQDGAERMIDILKEELSNTMAMAGHETVASLRRD
jgi:isopentenyl diphosphate isomerase/L-lactate dehydrogenase-like FMN-dependent dehydrogenase